MPPDLLMAVGLALAVAVVGMPHGGLDHRVGEATFGPRFGSGWPGVFAGFYLGLAAVVVGGWLVFPVATIVVFFGLSAYHFGHADDRPGLWGVLEGGIVIWVPLLARPAEVAEILAWVIPRGEPASVAVTLSQIRPVLWGFAGLLLGRVLILLRAAARTRTWNPALVGARFLAFALASSLLPVLVSFGLFFCGWHSIRELLALAHQADPSNRRRGMRTVLRLAAPRAGLAVVVTAGVAAWFSAGREVTPVIVQAVFLGLSAVAVPHILLQVLAERANANPFRVPSGVTA